MPFPNSLSFAWTLLVAVHSVIAGVACGASGASGDPTAQSVEEVLPAAIDDTTPPAAPVGLSVTAGDRFIVIDWGDNSEVDLAGYNILRGTTTGGPYTQLNGTLLAASVYTDHAVNYGATYHYVVQAVDNSPNTNSSAYSLQVTGTPFNSPVLVENFESHPAGSAVLFRAPGYSGTTSGIASGSLAQTSTAESNNTLDSTIGGTGTGSNRVSWTWSTAGAGQIRLTTANTSVRPNPLLSLEKGLSVYVKLPTGQIDLALQIRETGGSGPIGADGGITGLIERTTPAVRIQASGDWQYVYFDIPNAGYTPLNGDGILTGDWGTLEALFITPVSGDPTTNFTLYVDDIYQGGEHTPSEPVFQRAYVSRPVGVMVSGHQSLVESPVARPVSVMVVREGDVYTAQTRPVSVMIDRRAGEGEVMPTTRSISALVAAGEGINAPTARAIGVVVNEIHDGGPNDAVARAVGVRVSDALNDDFAYSELVEGMSGGVSGSTRGASSESGEPNHQGATPFASVWYHWIAPNNGVYRFTSCVSSIDARVAVYTGDFVGQLNAVTSVDSTSFCRPRSGVTFRAMEGTVYRIALDGHNQSVGAVQLDWAQVPPPTNDDFEASSPLVADAGEVLAQNSPATAQLGEAAHAGRPAVASLWWSWTPPRSGIWEFNTCASSFNTTLAIYTGDSLGALVPVVSNDNCCGNRSRIEYLAVGGTTYRIAVDSADGALGSLGLSWRPVSPPADDSFAGALPLEGSEGVHTGSHFGATREFGEPTHGSATDTRSTWYRWIAPRSGIVRLTVSGSVRIAAYTGNSLDGLTLLDTVPNGLLFTAQKGTEYRVAISSGGCSPADFQLIWGYDAPPLLAAGLGTLRDGSISPDGVSFLSAGGGGAYTWNLDSHQLLRRFSGHTARVNSAAWDRSGNVLYTGSEDSTIRLWDVRTAVELRRFRQPSPVTVVAPVSGTQLLLTGGSDGIVRAWNTESGTVSYSFGGFSGGITALAVSPDGAKAVVGSGVGEAVLFDAISVGVTRSLEHHEDQINSLRFSADGNSIISASDDGDVCLWSRSSGSLIRTFPGFPGSRMIDASTLPDGQRLVVAQATNGTAGANAMRILRISDGNILGSIPAGDASIVRMVVKSEAEVVVMSEDGQIATVNLDSGNKSGGLVGHTRSVGLIAFAPDGLELLGRTATGDELRWSLPDGVPLGSPVSMPPLTTVATTSDGLLFAQAGGESSTLIYELRPPRAIVVAGGGPYLGNSIAEQTHDLGVYTYRTLLARGYKPEDILYLSAFPEGTSFPIGQPSQGESVSWDVDGDAVDDVDGPATRVNLNAALTGDFAREAGRLLVLMVDHGYKTNDFMAFRLNPGEAVKTTEVNAWLNELQNAVPVDVTLVVDCCYSGHFVEDCRKTSAIPPERARIVIASTSKDNEAVFLPAPDLTSFMYTFLGSAYMGNSMGESFRSGARFFSAFPVAGQQPIIDDGEVQTTGVELATTRANREFFGASWAYGVQADNNINRFFPAFESVSPTGSIAPGSPVTVQAVMRPFQTPRRVKAVIKPPAAEVLSGEPVVGLPYKILEEPVGGTPETGLIYSYTWQPTDADSPFSLEGLYRITFTAEFDNLRLSDPEDTTVLISDEPDPDMTPIRTVLAFDEAPGNPGLALALAGDFAYARYLDKFQERIGTEEAPAYVHRPEWIDYFTNNPSTLPAKSTRKVEQRMIDVESQKSGGVRLPHTKSALLSGIATRGAEAGLLYVHLAAFDASNGVLTLGTETITAEEMDSTLDAVQSDGTEVILILDASGSGSFLTACAPTGNQSRIVIASAAENQCALFLHDPPVTFTHKLMGPLWSGETYSSAFAATRSFFTNFVGEFAGTRLEPQMIDGRDGDLARSRWLGRRFAFAGDEASGLPFVVSAEVVPATEPGQRPRLRATLMNGIDPATDPADDPLDGYRVFANVTPEGLLCGTGATELPRIRLRRESPTSWTWSAPVSSLIQSGTYPVSFVAEYPDGEGNTRESTPIFETLEVAQTTGSDPDPFEPGDGTPAGATLLPAGLPPQAHTIHQADDEDWFRFILDGRDAAGNIASIPYTFGFSNLSLPSGSQFHVTIFLDGVPLSIPTPEGCTSFEDILCNTVDDGAPSATFLTDGFNATQQVWARVALLGIPNDPLAPVEYSVDLYRTIGANNSIVASIGTVTNNKGTTSVEGIVTVETGLPFRTDDSSLTYENIAAIRLYRQLIRNDALVGGRLLVDEWSTSQAPFEKCVVTGNQFVTTVAPAAVLRDRSLEGTAQVGDLVVYFIDVVDGLDTEKPADLAGYPAWGVYLPETQIVVPDCTGSANPQGVSQWSLR